MVHFLRKSYQFICPTYSFFFQPPRTWTFFIGGLRGPRSCWKLVCELFIIFRNCVYFFSSEFWLLLWDFRSFRTILRLRSLCLWGWFAPNFVKIKCLSPEIGRVNFILWIKTYRNRQISSRAIHRYQKNWNRFTSRGERASQSRWDFGKILL